MEVKDLLITPLYLALIYLVAYMVRPMVTDKLTVRYFLPALTVKIIGAIALGMIYQFYYNGGDTFNYFHHGSRWIWEAFLDSPQKGLRLIFLADGRYEEETFEYASRMWYYRDLPSYFVVRVAGLFDLFTFHTYSATAVLFAVMSFSGLWAMYKAFYNFFPMLHKEFAVAVFFIPSVFFWGSGIMKDSITLGALAWSTYAVIQILFEKRRFVSSALIIVFAYYTLYVVKIYILLSFLPAIMMWVFLSNYKKIPNRMLRVVSGPVVFLLMIGMSYLAFKKVGESSSRYSIENLSHTAEVTARWLTHVSNMEGGSGYTLGDFDYSLTGMIKKFPLAVWTTLFRPHLWEVRNPVMLLSALEGMFMLLLSWSVFRKSGLKSFLSLPFKKPEVTFCFIFATAFAFAVGMSTYNFGSLVRYKIPLIPFYFIGLFILKYYSEQKNDSRIKGA